MEEMIRFGNFFIQPVYLEREFNFIVIDGKRYCCRLVPGSEGFELSALDKALGIDPGENFVNCLGAYIFSYYL